MGILCFDIGGMSIKYGLLKNDGEIVIKDRIKTPEEDCKNKIPALIAKTALEIQKKHSIKAIGVSTAGQVDSENGVIVFSANIPGYSGCKMKTMVEKATGIKVVVENDANCAALGEMWKGAGKENKYMIFMTLGTGVGGAIIINNKLYKGYHGFAGEFSRLVVSGKLVDATGKNPNTMDYMASTSSLIRRYKDLSGIEFSGPELMDDVRAEEKTAVAAYDDFIESILSGINSITTFFDPQVIVVGGGISAQGDFFFDHINKKFQERAYPGYEDLKIKKAELENDAGIYGAGYICLHKDYAI